MEMIRKIGLAFIGFVFVLVALWVPASIYSCHHKHQSQEQENKQSEAEKSAIAHGAVGDHQINTADAIRSARAPLEQKIKELEWKLEKSNKKPSENTPAHQEAPIFPDTMPEAIKERDDLISAYQEKTKSLEAENASLRVSVTEFKAQAEEYRRGMVAAQLASEAQKAAAKSARMTGRVEGFGFGALAGWGFKSIAVKFRF